MKTIKLSAAALTLVNRNTNAAIGVNTTACSEIGNIGKSDACD
jgi:hypothetical protein